MFVSELDSCCLVESGFIGKRVYRSKISAVMASKVSMENSENGVSWRRTIGLIQAIRGHSATCYIPNDINGTGYNWDDRNHNTSISYCLIKTGTKNGSSLLPGLWRINAPLKNVHENVTFNTSLVVFWLFKVIGKTSREKWLLSGGYLRVF